MSLEIRDYQPADEEPVVALSLRAWAPVFASMEAVLGRELLSRLHPDWRHDQEQAVRAVLNDPAMRIWVATAGAEPAGFAAARRVYERAGYTNLPVARYFRSLG